MTMVLYFWHDFNQRGTTFMYLKNTPLLFITICQTFGRHRTPLAHPSLLTFRMDRPIARISSSVVPGPSQWFFHFGEEVVITWTQEKTITLGGTEPHHSSWQCKESHHWCHGPLAPLAMGDSGTSTVLTRYESMRFFNDCNTSFTPNVTRK